MTIAADDAPSYALYHVAAGSLPIGQVLRPYTIAVDHLDHLQAAGSALRRGSRAVRQLLGKDEWRQLRERQDPLLQMILLEATFEHVRLQVSPDLPSRYHAVFGWRTIDRAIRYRDAYRPHGVIHHCTVTAGRSVERDGALIVETFEATDVANPWAENLQRMEEIAVRYWLGNEPMAFPELLVHGTVVVRGTVDPGPAG